MSDTGNVRVAIVTIGCRANAADSTMMAEALAAEGLELVARDGEADVYVVNTCTVTHRADADARGTVRRIARRRPSARIVLTGCMAQVAPEAGTALPGVAAVVGNREKHRICDVVRAVARGGPVPAGGPGDAWGPVALRPTRDVQTLPGERARPAVKVQDGCDGHCTYCIVPKARGPSRSLPLDEVVETLAAHGARGAQEVVLTGIHVGRYGADLRPQTSLVALLDRLDRELPPLRIRLSSLEPDEVGEELFELLRRPRFCAHLHLPLQSGDDPILRAMARTYTTADYAGVVARARQLLPSAAIGADVIVGFPGEDDASFRRTMTFVEGLDLTYLHVFAFSPREGTPAAALEGRVDEREIRERSAALRRLGESKRDRFHARLEGAVEWALVEGAAAEGSDRMRGLTGNFVPVEVEGASASAGQLLRVRLGRSRGRRVAATPCASADTDS